MEPFQDVIPNSPPISLSQIRNKELYIPLYVKDSRTGQFEIVSMPVKYEKLVELFYPNPNAQTENGAQNDNSSKPNPRRLGISLNSPHGLVDSSSHRENPIFGNSRKNPALSLPRNNSNPLIDRPLSYTDKIINSFLKESCLESSSSLTSRNELQEAYQQWSQHRGQPHIAGNVMADYLNTLYKTTKIKKKVYYVGIQLK